VTRNYKDIKETREQLVIDGKAQLLTQVQLSVALGVHPITISRWTNSNVIPSYRLGKVVRYDLQSVLKAMEGKQP
jgi:hypothetical protein